MLKKFITMRYLCTLFVVILLGNSLCSAQGYSDEIPIMLTTTSNLNLDTNSLKAINSVSLQALTPDTSVVGYISDTLSNATYNLIPQTQLTGWLQSYVNSTYSPVFSDTGKHVYWIIKKFSLSESISTSSVYVHVEADIYSNSSATVQWTIDTALKFSQPVNNDYSVPFQNALQFLVSYSANKIISSGNVSILKMNRVLRKLSMQTRDYSTYPIIQDSVINEGAFLTLSQFANDAPAVTNIFIVADTVSTNGVVHIYHQNDDSTLQELTSVVAVCINGELYACLNHHLIAIERTSNSMLISRYRDPDLRTNQAMYMRMILRDSPGNENPFSKEYKCTSPGNQDIVATCVDLDTGDLSF